MVRDISCRKVLYIIACFVLFGLSFIILACVLSPLLVGLLPPAQNPRRHPSIPRVYTYKDNKKQSIFVVEKERNSGRSVLDLTKLGAHSALG